MIRSLFPLAMLVASPALAQVEDEPMADEAMADDMMADEDAEAGADETGPQPTYILAASDRFLTAYASDGWLDPALEICIEEGEVVQLARPQSRIATMELRGPLCTLVSAAPEAATIIVERGASPTRVRAGAVRGATTARGTGNASLPSASFRVASGSAGVLERFPRGSRVGGEAELCLARGEQVTLVSSRGQRVTYRGPGCARRNTRATGDNLGGFTFGWNGYGAALRGVMLP